MQSVFRRKRWLLLAGLVVLSVWFWRIQTAQGSTPQQAPLASPGTLRKVEPGLLRQMLERPDEQHRFVVRMRDEVGLPAADALVQLNMAERRRSVVQALRAGAERSQSAIAGFLANEQAAGRATQVRRFWVFNGLAVTGRLSTALALAERDDIRALLVDREYRLPSPKGTGITAGAAYTGTVEWNLQKIRADRVWDGLKIDGTGVIVGSMDTGVDWLHPALYGSYRGNVGKGMVDHRTSWLCATDEGYATPTDVYGHGTHTTGTIVGRTADRAIGVSPGARWIAAKIFKDDGTSYASWIHAGFEWMLDPGDTGDPVMAPQVVNNSWGSAFGDDGAFQADVQAWRAAGIVPVFAAGNDGPFEWTINAPGSYPESIAVGATDRDDQPAVFSSRGPTLWNGIKPNVVAPGYTVVSSLPGGRYGSYNGTSMATPHVTGLVALLLQSDQTLAVNQIEGLLTSTAVHLGRPSPNYDYGWGRIDAFQATATAMHPGSLQGSVRRITDGRAIQGAQVAATGLLPEQGQGSAASDANGAYHIPLAGWTYDVSVFAFGYYPASASAIPVPAGTQTSRNFTLSQLPSGVIHGFVTELGTGAPLSATIVVSGTPLAAFSSATNGEYGIEVPAGTYTVEVRRAGHRVGRALDVSVGVDQVAEKDFSLQPAPTIVVVDSGVWYNSGQSAFFRQALDALDYVYDVRPIRFIYGSERDVPAAAELRRYDIVIWSSPNDSPGYVGAWGALRAYLDGGGKLLLTGQNIGYWDGTGGQFASPEYGTYAHARYARDDAGSRRLLGLPGELLDGAALVLNGSDSADNQDSPDAVRSADEASGIPVAVYDGQIEAGALQTASCTPYRLLYFSFGFEGINPAATRLDTMERALAWFAAPLAASGVRLTPLQQTSIQAPGGTVTYSVQVHNTSGSGQADIYALTLSPHAWPTSISSDTVTVAPCGVTTVTLRVDIPADAPRNIFEAVTVTVRSLQSPTLEAGAVISTETAAPILLVDHDRWYDQEAAYRSALDANKLPYDYWNVGWTASPGLGSPPADRLKMYPVIIWFTGYDWSSAVSPIEEQRLSIALDAGSRLLLSSQDYLYARGLDGFGHSYLGIGSYTGDVTTTEAIGNQRDPIGNLLGPYELIYPFPDRSDVVEPAFGDASAFRGSHDRPIAIRHQGGAYRTSFFGFPIEAVPDTGRAEVIRQGVGWLSWLGQSTLTGDRSHVLPGDSVAYTVTLRNDGPQAVTGILTDTLPNELEPVPGSLYPPEATYEPGTRILAWTGPLTSGGSQGVGLRVTVDPDLIGAQAITHTASIAYPEHRIHFERAAVLHVGAPDLDASALSVSALVAQPRDVLTYTISLANQGLGVAASAYLTNPIPAGTHYLTGSLQLDGAGSVLEVPGGIRWDGPIAPGEHATLTFSVQIDSGQYGAQISDVAYLYDGFGLSRRLRVWTQIGWIEYDLPILLRNYLP